MKDQSDEKLMEKLAMGQTEAFNVLYKRYSNRTYSFALSKLESRKDSAADVHQITWEKVYKKAHTFKMTEKFSSWLFKITRNAIIDELRKIFRQNQLIQSLEKESVFGNLKNECKSIDIPIETLKSPYRDALEMRYLKGMEINEIAKTLNIKETNARKVISRGLKKIKSYFGEIMKQVNDQGEYDFFLKSTQPPPPAHLSETIKNRMEEYTGSSSRKIVFKYTLTFTLGALVSLFFCPQKGVGFLKDNYLLFSHVLHSNKLLCGFYCGGFFFLITHTGTLLSLNHYERIKIFKKLWILPHGLFSLFFGIFMLISEDTYNFSFAYNLAWLMAIFMGLRLMEKLFLRYFAPGLLWGIP